MMPNFFFDFPRWSCELEVRLVMRWGIHDRIVREVEVLPGGEVVIWQAGAGALG